MCDCLVRLCETTKKYKEENSTLKGYEVSRVEFSHTAINLGMGTVVLGIPVEVSSSFEKKDGTRSNEKKEICTIYCSYCPFCGEKKQTKQEESENETT